MIRIYKLRNYQFGLVFLALALSVIGILLIGSAQMEVRNRQLAGVVIGLILMIAASLSDYKYLTRFSWVLYGIAIGGLLLVWIAGASGGGAERWLEIGSFRFQPSELAKVLLILFFAWFFDKHQNTDRPLRVIGAALALAAVPCLMILRQPDLSTTIVVAGVFGVLLFLSDISYKIIRNLVLAVIPILAGFLYLVTRPGQTILSQYQYERIMSWLNPGAWSQESYQQQNSILAIGSGMLRGKGLNNTSALSVKNAGFIPEPQTDFIMAVAGEELGFWGCLLIVMLLLLIVIYCIRIGTKARDLRGRLICGGVAALIGGQAFINICVVTGIMPNTGLTLPFVSYGLSSLLACFIGIGLVLNVGLQQRAPGYEKLLEDN